MHKEFAYSHEHIAPKVSLEPVKQSIQTRTNWQQWLNDPEISQWMYSQKQYTPHEIYRWIDTVTRDERRHYFSIVTDAKPVGFISIRQDQQPSNTAEIGIVIGEKNMQSKGLGRQAVEQALDYATHVVKLDSVRANIKPNNTKSIKLFTGAGFVHTATLTIDGNEFMKFEKVLR